MCRKNETMLEDVIKLINMIRNGLETEQLDTIIELYDYYRLVDKAIKSTKMFIDGYFLMDINQSIFQETKSFLTPEAKWSYFTQVELKKFNDDILKLTRQCWMIGFSFNSNTKNLLLYHLGKYSSFIPFREHDNKFKFSDTCKEIEYEYINLKQYSNEQLKCCRSIKDLLTNKTFYIETKEQKDKLIAGIKINLYKLEEFKLYLEYYFLKNNIPISMFVAK